MKKLLTLTLLVLTTTVFAQPGDAELKAVWDNQIKAIIDLDNDKIREYCAPYVGGEWGYVIGLETEAEEWTVADLLASSFLIFDDQMRGDLKYGDPSMFELVEGEEGYELHLVLFSFFEEEGEMYESATILVYRLYEGEWKLSAIQYAG